MPNPTPTEDAWAFVLYGSPFPDNPVKCFGQQNMYVALWYKHGKPMHGRAWNEGGVVEASFPYSKVELTGSRDLKGEIQVLQYKGDHTTLGYWYNWIKFKERNQKPASERQIVKCGDSIPIYWASCPTGGNLGYLNLATNVALFSRDKKAMEVKGADVDDMLIIVRELVGGPPTCECAECSKDAKIVQVMDHVWADYRFGDSWPKEKLVQALSRSLKTVPGENPEQHVALWYQSGEPVMGRVWNEGGKIAGSFSWGNHEYRANLGSLQLLVELPSKMRGYDYDWRPFAEAAKFGDKIWFPVHINHVKGDISPGVLIVDGKEILGKVDVRNERASAGFGGKETAQVGPQVQSCKVLCRKAKPGCKFT